MEILLKSLPSLLSKLAIAALLIGFWWPIRKQTYGKSLPWLVAIFTVSFILSAVAYPTYTRYLGQLLQATGALHTILPKVIFWLVAVCDSLFAFLIVVLILSDIAALIPSEFWRTSNLHRFLVATYSKIAFVGITLLILRILPLLVIIYCTSHLRSPI